MLLSENFSYRQNNRNWEGFTSICSPDVMKNKLQDNPLIVVHHGMRNLKVAEQLATLNLTLEYPFYLTAVKKKVAQTCQEGRSVIAFMPVDFLQQSLQALGNLPQLIVVPTHEDRVEPVASLLKLTQSRDFFPLLSQVISRAELIGEYGHRCVFNIARLLAKNKILVSLNDRYIAPRKFRQNLIPSLRLTKLAQNYSYEYRISHMEDLFKKYLEITDNVPDQSYKKLKGLIIPAGFRDCMELPDTALTNLFNEFAG